MAVKPGTINRQMEKHIESTEMWFLGRMMRIPWTARKTNTEILIVEKLSKTYPCRSEEKTGKVYRSCSLKREAGGLRDNRKNMWKSRQRKTTRKNTRQLG
jgi:hypothetical protein